MVEDPIHRIMRKVAGGKRLTKHDKEILSAIADAQHKSDVRDSGTPLERVMRKIAEGKKLTKHDREILSAALSAVPHRRTKRKTKVNKPSKRKHSMARRRKSHRSHKKRSHRSHRRIR